MLRENPLKAIARFLNEGVLELADLPELVDYSYKVSDLKNMLQKRELKISGRKVELIQRIIANDPEEMARLTKDLKLYRCTPEGIELAECYLENEKSKRVDAERESLYFLEKRDFTKAVRVMIGYEASQVFPRGIGIDWHNYDSESDLILLKTIFETTPSILKNVRQSQLHHLRLAAGMMQLWGTNRVQKWLPDNFELNIHISSYAACRMLVFHASYLRNLEEYKKLGIKVVEILGVGNESSCFECRKISGGKYKLNELPELPYAQCTCKMGCRCTTVVGEFG